MSNFIDGKRNNNIDMIKWLAIITMVVDHLRYIIPRYQLESIAVGRLAFIMFALALAFNAMQLVDNKKYKSLKTYYLNLIFWFFISELPYQWSAQGHTFGTKNIMLTLFLGLSCILLLNITNKNNLNYVLFILLLMLCVVINQSIQYGFLGVLLIVVFYLTLKAKQKIYKYIGVAVAIILACACNLQYYDSIIADKGFFDIWVQSMLMGCILGTVFALALVFDLFNTSKLKVKPVGKWGWWFYPVHLMIIFLIGKFLIW